MQKRVLKCIQLSPRPISFAAVLITALQMLPASAQQAQQTPQPASTCPDQPAMTFSAWTSNLGRMFGEGPREYIFADGYICSDTDHKFSQFLTQNPPQAPNTIVVLNSGGGNLAAGMRLGKIIRQKKMWTQVGSQLPLMISQNENIRAEVIPYLTGPVAPPFAGECDSSCTLAFMGGIHRTIGYASNYGVHQFASANNAPDPNLQVETEAASAAIVAYLNEMGISPNYMVYMVQKSGNAVTNLTMKQLQELNILTPRWKTGWKITTFNDNSGFFLEGTTTDPWGSHEIAFRCPPKPNPTPVQSNQAAPSASLPALLADFYLDPGTRAQSQDLVGAVQGYALELSGLFVPITLTAKQAPPVVSSSSKRLSTTIVFPASLVQALESGNIPYMGIAFLFDPAAKLPLRLLKFEADLNTPLLKQFESTCH